MPYRVYPPKPRSKSWRIKGTHFGVFVDRSSRTTNRREAEEVARAWEREVYEREILGIKPPHPFHMAVIDYVDSGGEKTWLLPLLEHFQDKDIRHITQSDLDRAANELHKGVAPSTKNRRVYTPFIAIMNLAVANGHCDYRKWRRPKKNRRTNGLAHA